MTDLLFEERGVDDVHLHERVRAELVVKSTHCGEDTLLCVFAHRMIGSVLEFDTRGEHPLLDFADAVLVHAVIANEGNDVLCRASAVSGGNHLGRKLFIAVLQLLLDGLLLLGVLPEFLLVFLFEPLGLACAFLFLLAGQLFLFRVDLEAWHFLHKGTDCLHIDIGSVGGIEHWSRLFLHGMHYARGVECRFVGSACVCSVIVLIWVGRIHRLLIGIRVGFGLIRTILHRSLIRYRIVSLLSMRHRRGSFLHRRRCLSRQGHRICRIRLHGSCRLRYRCYVLRSRSVNVVLAGDCNHVKGRLVANLPGTGQLHDFRNIDFLAGRNDIERSVHIKLTVLYHLEDRQEIECVI